QITLEFDLNRSLDGAAVDVQGAITQAARLLPQGMPTPPTFTKVNPADQPILYLVITSTTVPPWTLDEYAETRIAQRISMVSGVAPVHLRELGNVVDGVEDERTASWFYTKGESQRAITLGIQRQPGTNTIAVADAVKA